MSMEQMQKDMVAAMKAKDKVRKDAISNLISAVKKLAIDEGKREDIPQELVDRAVLKEVKTAKEQVDTCPADREDLRAEYQARLDIMTEYAPKMLSAEEIEEILTTKYADVIATKNKGLIMKTVMADLKGKADGKDINMVVGKLTN
ncbi:MAG: GatB/YqeY domain-containing protein [Lachnospiraceae bacterium]|nr:GatB/YqeY domain-containing protein [Lachnospiraceae bacterium]